MTVEPQSRDDVEKDGEFGPVQLTSYKASAAVARVHGNGTHRDHATPLSLPPFHHLAVCGPAAGPEGRGRLVLADGEPSGEFGSGKWAEPLD